MLKVFVPMKISARIAHLVCTHRHGYSSCAEVGSLCQPLLQLFETCPVCDVVNQNRLKVIRVVQVRQTILAGWHVVSGERACSLQIHTIAEFGLNTKATFPVQQACLRSRRFHNRTFVRLPCCLDL